MLIILLLYAKKRLLRRKLPRRRLYRGTTSLHAAIKIIRHLLPALLRLFPL